MDREQGIVDAIISDLYDLIYTDSLLIPNIVCCFDRHE